MKAWTLDIVGHRLAPVDLTVKGDRVSLRLAPDARGVYYELSAP